MKGTSAPFIAHLAQGSQTVCQCLRVLLTNGDALFFTDHDENIVIAGWTGSYAMLNGTYLAMAGFFATDVVTTDRLNVDNTELSGPQVTPGMIEADITAGKWDKSRNWLFQVNWMDLSQAMGPHYLRVGGIGQVTVEDGKFKSEVRGLMQAYNTGSLVELTSPGCRYNFGDSRCTKDLAALRVSGTITGVRPDNMTISDTGRTEPGPSAGVAITGITNANPAVVTMTNATLHLTEGQPVTLAGIVGMPILNSVTVARSPSGSTFRINIDTTNTGVYGTYSSGGTVTPFGAESGYFDGGVLTFKSAGTGGGLNHDLSMEVKSYVPGQITLMQPMPYLIAIGDQYTMTPGCNKTPVACKGWANFVNFGGEPDIGGQDKLLQVGRHV